MVNLVPVSEWIWNLYEVRYTDESDRLIRTERIVSTDTHIYGDADEAAPSRCTEFSWERLIENVPAPRQIGTIYGQPVYEGGIAAAKRHN